ncbi:hypothetical protein AVEN_172533-1 [Araneus ventricosus]|uniref:RNase H type-1 domain-containing protein n=1 Tax=Araneus ventricosus TaxID=182803 RepID=A0A4Y2K3G8_ARAVE|nr:hypothetical protein AVEN_172533-1 [Araneus ventricosus]
MSNVVLCVRTKMKEHCLDENYYECSIPMMSTRKNMGHNTDFATNFEVYTDGSRIEDETGFAVCIFQENNNIENHLYKLKSHNSVFQAELAAIHCAANWAASKNVSINIHTDSLSSIAAIKSASARSSFVNNIKQDLVKIKHLVGLSWVKAHVGIQGNELADQQAKLATTTGVDTIIPAPRSYVKRLLNKLMIKEWNDYWRQYNSTSGARVREYLEHCLERSFTNIKEWVALEKKVIFAIEHGFGNAGGSSCNEFFASTSLKRKGFTR